LHDGNYSSSVLHVLCSILKFPTGSVKPQIILTFSDVHSLYPGNGVSDAIIDFFSRLVIALCVQG